MQHVYSAINLIKPMSTSYTIQQVVTRTPFLTNGLAKVTSDAVSNGASIGFMQPFTIARAITFWEKVFDRVERGEVILLVAQSATGEVLGTVQLIVDLPENQPHRADVAKMQVHSKARRQGIGAALLQAVERVAVEAGKNLLVLDTASGSDAQRLYTKSGWQKVGEIPDYALLPGGGFCNTTVFYKKL